jgi:predicted hydrocarbon binding protein
MMKDDSTDIENNETNNTNDPFEWNYYTFYRIPVIINNKIISNDGKSTVLGREIGRVFAEYKDNLVVIDGENKKEREYLIPKRKIDRYDKNQIFLNISEDSLKDFEF